MNFKLLVEYLLCYSTAFFIGFLAGIGVWTLLHMRNGKTEKRL